VERLLWVGWMSGSDGGVAPESVWADMAETGSMDDSIQRMENDQDGNIIAVKD